MNFFARFIFTLCAGLIAFSSWADTPILTPAWQSEALFQQPESVVFDPKSQLLYVSNINGDPNQADGNGYISQLTLDGEIPDLHWLEGLNAPKGMTIVGNNLYVADINELIVIDIANKKISQRYLAKEAKFLNDVAADSEGTIYVSDMVTDTIYRLKNDQFDAWLIDEKLEKPNGLLIEKDQLIVGSWGVMTDGFATKVAGHLKSIDLTTKTITSLGDASPAGNLDGVEADGDGDGNYLVTDWINGKLLHISPTGISQTLISLEQGSADHTVLAQQQLVIIPMMMSEHVIAFNIKK